jgi:hypothetical protein
VSLDREFDVLVRAEQLDAKGGLARQFDLGSFEKVQDQWLMKSFDLLDSGKRDSDQFIILDSALKLRLDPEIFNPVHLNAPAETPAAAVWAQM